MDQYNYSPNGIDYDPDLLYGGQSPRRDDRRDDRRVSAERQPIMMLQPTAARQRIAATATAAAVRWMRVWSVPVSVRRPKKPAASR